MGILLFVTKAYDGSFNETGQEIVREEWLRLVDEDPALRLRTEAFSSTNPETGEVVSFPAGDAQAEFRLDDDFVPFLRYHGGELSMRYMPEFENPDSLVRRKIAEVARRLGALITHDAADEILDW